MSPVEVEVEIEGETMAGKNLIAGAAALALVALLSTGCEFLKDAPTGDPMRIGGDSLAPSISGDGRYVAIESLARNLLPGDENEAYDIYRWDVLNNSYDRVSVDASGGDSDGASGGPSISTDGRYVAFVSAAPDLVAGDGNGVADIFRRDMQTGTTVRVSLAVGGGEANGASGTRAAIANGSGVSMSGDGRFVAFASAASNLVPNDTNGLKDVFVRDMQTGVTTRASVDTAGGDPNGASDRPAISRDGSTVAFSSTATDLGTVDNNGTDDIYVRHLAAGTTTRASVDTGGGNPNGPSTLPSIDVDGTVVAFTSTAPDLVSGDTNGAFDVFVRNLATGTMTQASVGANGGNGTRFASASTLSADGRFVAFGFDDPDKPETVFAQTDSLVRDLSRGVTVRADIPVAHAAPGTSGSQFDAPALNVDGRYVAYTSAVETDPNIAGQFVHLRALRTPEFDSGQSTGVAPGATAVVHLTGHSFLPGATARLLGGDGKVTVTAVNVISETSLDVTVHAAPDAAAGIRTLSVSNLGTGPGPSASGNGLCNCLTVTSP